MAGFMTKKKKYKFQVDVCLEELLEVPFVAGVLFAKLRLLDGGNFQDHSKRQEVKDHTVKWGDRYSFPCKMQANASTGVLERCILRISVRRECKGGRSFTKLGFVDLNLAEFAGAGETCKKALLEGYDTRHRQDNSILKISLKMNMLSGDILFKVPSPSLKQKAPVVEEVVAIEPAITTAPYPEPSSYRGEECSGGSLAGSIASGSSGFGSLPKKRPPLLSSELVINQPALSENNAPPTLTLDSLEFAPTAETDDGQTVEHGHSRNSSNTSQMSKASGYSSTHSHSRQSSSGDSGHIRNFSSSSLVLSETGSLERAKAAHERRKKTHTQEQEVAAGTGRVEGTRVNTDRLIDELLKNTNLEPADDSAESSGLQLFITKDGTSVLGSHEVKSQMSTGVFKQVVMEDTR